jgi:hypothetical protein
MQQEFEMTLEGMPEAEKETVRRYTADYTVPILVNFQSLGTGTLVRIAGQPGILTAEHVVNPGDRKLRMVSPDDDQVFQTSIADYPHLLQIESKWLTICRTARTSDLHGPDLAFIKLPPGPFLSAVETRKSFLPIDPSNVDERINKALEQSAFMAFIGFPAEDKRKSEPSHGFSEVELLQGYTFFTGQEKYYMEKGWDYLEVGVSRKPGNTAPESFGGVSGGGLWTLPIERKAWHPPGKEYFAGIFFAGVAFYESDTESGHQFIRAHGPESIYRKFCHEILNSK